MARNISSRLPGQVLVLCLLVTTCLFLFYATNRTTARDDSTEVPNPMTLAVNSSYIETEVIFTERCRNAEPQAGEGPEIHNKFVNDILDRKAIWLDVPGDKRDNDGWGNFAPEINRLFPKVFETSKSDVFRIIEIGSFKGRSTIQMAKHCQFLATQYNKTCQIIAVDTWLSSPEHVERKLKDIKQMYQIFLNNVKFENLTDIITPFRMPSTGAAHVFHCFHITADVLFVDSYHEYFHVLTELKMYYPLVKENGLLFGDDYTSWKGVTKAVDDFANLIGNDVHHEGTTWSMFKKDEKPRFIAKYS